MISLILKRRKLSRQIQSDIKLKLPNGSSQFLKDLFQEKPNDLLAAFRASKWTIPYVDLFTFLFLFFYFLFCFV